MLSLAGLAATDSPAAWAAVPWALGALTAEFGIGSGGIARSVGTFSFSADVRSRAVWRMMSLCHDGLDMDTLPPILPSITVGAIAGGLLTATWQTIQFAIHNCLPGAGCAPWFVGVYVFALASIIWWIGLVLFGVGPWLLLHRRGYRRWWTAALLGVVMTFVITFALLTLPVELSNAPGSSAVGGVTMVTNGSFTHAGWFSAVDGAALNAVAGLAVALVVWWAAYRPRSR